MKILSYILSICLIAICLSSSAAANIIQAASCSESDVQYAVNIAQDGDSVLIPSGNCTWTGSVLINNKSVNVIGPGSQNITIIVEGSSAFILKAEINGSNASRISGFTFNVTNASAGIEITCEINEGCSQNWRVDHNEFINNSGSTKEMIFGFGNPACYPFGLIDNNIIHDGRIVVFGETYDTGGNSRWAEPLDIGTVKSIYVEDNIFYTTAYNGSYVNWIDGNVGTRYVFRFNTAYNAWTETHSVQGDDHRAQRLWELYNNTMICNDAGNCWMPMRMRGGTGVVFNNITSGYNQDKIFLDNVRSCFDYAPNWGMCNGNSWIDGNEPGLSGWLCRDQPGASTDASLWDFSSPAPIQERAPMYAWNNKGNSGVEMPFEVLDFCPENLIHIQENREFYNYTETFDGTSGVGIGTLANRPPTCTPGVAYWATDVGTWNQNGEDGILFKCTSTNTWEIYYEPFSYPHPLRQNDLTTVEDKVQLKEFVLYQNYPNPFNPTTKISFRIPERNFITLKVYDVLGNETAILINEYRSAGIYEVEFDASGLPSGIYFYQLSTKGYIQTRKMSLIK
jgi:hypothetical protein